MRSDWNVVTVQDLVAEGVLAPPIDGNHGEIHPKTADFVPAGIPFIMASDLMGGQVDLNGCSYITPEQARTLRKGFSKQGDVLLSHKATIGRTAIVGQLDTDFIVLTPQVTYYRVKDSKRLDRQFLKYYFDSPEFQQVLATWAGAGSTRAYLGITAQRKLPVVLPPIGQQLAISAVLQPVDDRINLLRQTNATLESIGRALFKSWFIDFDPVRAKAEGREPEGMDAATAALFPAQVEESALGLVPKGWRISEIGQVAQCVGGGTPSTGEPAFWEPGVHHWATPKDLSRLGAPVLLETERRLTDAGLAKVSSGLLPAGTLLMSSRAPIGYLALAQVPVAVNQGFVAMRPGGELPPQYLYFWCQANMDAIKQKANGSTFMEISKAAFRPISLVVPHQRVVERFGELVGAIFERIADGERYRARLEELRDTLLPRLISGKLRLPEAAEQIEEATA